MTDEFKYESLVQAIVKKDKDEFIHMIESGRFDHEKTETYGANLFQFLIDTPPSNLKPIIDMAKYLIEKTDLDLNIKNARGLTPLDLAYLSAKGRMARLFQKHNGTTTLINLPEIVQYTICGYLDKVVRCLNDGQKMEYDNYHLIHQAARSGWLHIIKYLILERKIDVNTQDDSGRTALHWAANEDHVEIVYWLVKVAHADITITDSDGNTALAFGQNYSVKWLLSQNDCDKFMNEAKARLLVERIGEWKNDKWIHEWNNDNFKINLSRMNIGNSGCKVIALALQSEIYWDCPLNIIDLSYNDRISDEGIMALVDGIKCQHNSLEEVIISNVSLSAFRLLHAATQSRNIKFSCEFPSLVTMAICYISNVLNPHEKKN